MMRGPQAIGVTGDSRLSDLIGRVWAFLFCDNDDWYLLQWVGPDHLETAPGLTSPGWLHVVDPQLTLPPLTAGVQRRFSAAFDQSARLTVAYEEAQTVKVTRWDNDAGQYVQNVTFSGADPCLVFDATWAYDIPQSDVLVFYLDAATRSKLKCRVQRDVYSVEHELWDYGQPVVLNRVTRLPLQYQVLASDEAGAPITHVGTRVGLLSDLYPYPGADHLTASGGVTDAVRHTHALVIHEGRDGITASALPTDAMRHTSTVYVYVDVEPANLIAGAGVAGAARHASTLYPYQHPLVGLTAAASVTGQHAHTRLLFITVDREPARLAASASVTGSMRHKEA